MGWIEDFESAATAYGRTRAYCLRPSGKPRRAVVALHGAGNDALFGWVRLFKELLLEGSLVYSFDLPGHGRGGDSRLDAASARAAIMRAVERTRAHAGDVRMHAVGVSLGGSLLLDALTELDDALASATLIVAPLRIELSPRSFLSETGPRSFSLIWEEREHYGLGGLIPSFGPFKRDIYPLRLAAPPPKGAFGYVDSLNAMLASLDLEARAESVRLPVLLAYGEADRIVPISQGERLAARLKSSRLVRVRRGTHLSTPLSSTVRQAVSEWIAR